MAAKKVETPTLGATVRFAGADASTGLFQLEVEMASAAKPWSLTKRYADFHFFHSHPSHIGRPRSSPGCCIAR